MVTKDFRQCLQCRKDPFNRICKSKNCMENKPLMTTIKTARREHKSHVPSACINCKIAHLACELSRPCKRCITLNKIETCQDTLQKKRGRPKQQETEDVSATTNNKYEILFGTIQTPTISKPSFSPQSNRSSFNLNIAFVHEPFPATLKTPSRIIEEDASFFSNHLILSMEGYFTSEQDHTTLLHSWGYRPYEFMHRSFYDFISPEDIHKFSTLHRRLLQDKNTTISDTIHIKKRAGDDELYNISCLITDDHIIVQFNKKQQRHSPPTTTFVNTVFAEGEQQTTFVNTIFMGEQHQLTEKPPSPTLTSSPIRLYPPAKQTKPQQQHEMSIRSLLC